MYFLGIDAGGTKTAFALGDETRTLATVAHGSAKLSNVSQAQARASLAVGIQNVCAAADIKPQQIKACAVGLSGSSVPEVRSLVMAELVVLLEKSAITIYGDHVIAHRAAFPDGVGVLTIAGTGSICYGRTRHGREMRSGGHGPLISDEGSGTWIGRELIRRLLRAQDLGYDFGVLEELIDRYGNGNPSELVRKANNGEINFAELAPLVTKAGDEFSTGLLQDAAAELASLAGDVALHLFESDERVKFALAGTVANLRIVKQEFLERIQRSRPDSEFVECSLAAAEGALIIARELA